MSAVPAAVSEMNVGEGFLRRNVRRVDTVSEQVVRGDVEALCQNAANTNAREDIDDIICEPAPIGETSCITSD